MFFIFTAGETIGPYSVEEVRRRLAQGAIAPDDYCWREGMADWQVIGETPILVEQRTAPASRRLKPAPVTMEVAKRPPKALPKTTAAAPMPKENRTTLPLIAMVIGALLALYCAALYPAALPADSPYAAGLQVLLREPVHAARLHDRIGGIVFGLILLATGAVVFFRAKRLAPD